MEAIWYNIGEFGTKEDKFQVRNMDDFKNCKRGRSGFTMPTLMSAVLPIVVKEGLKEENIEAIIDLILKGGKKISGKVAEYLEKRKQQGGTGEEIPDDVQKEVQATVRELMEEQARPVYMSGVAFLFRQRMQEAEKEELEQYLTHINTEEPADGDCQKEVDQFMMENYGCELYKNENDYWIGDDCLYLNLSFDDEGYCRLCNEEAIRRLADALNRLLGDRYITGFFTY